MTTTDTTVADALRGQLFADRPDLAALAGDTGDLDFSAITPMLLQRLLGGEGDEAMVEDDEGSPIEELRRVRAERDALLTRLQKSTQSMLGLVEQTEQALEQLDDLAAALGACEECWGDDTHCDVCDGEGVPGWDQPDPEAFATFVAPVIRRLQTTRTRRPATTAPAAPAPLVPKTEPNSGGMQ